MMQWAPEVDASAFEEAAAQCGLPFTLLDVTAKEAGAAYGTKLVLVRPDQHVAWRGDALPKDTHAFVDTIRGAVMAAA